MPNFTKNDARRIAKKLGADIREGGKHTVVVVRKNKMKIARFGIPRGTREHDLIYLPNQLGITNSETRKLADCCISKEKYFSIRQSRE